MCPARMAKLEAGIRLVLEFNEAFNRHDVPGMTRLLSEDCLFEDTRPAPDGTSYKGREAISNYWIEFFQTSQQAHIEIEEIFSFGYRCIMRWKYDWVDAAGRQGHVRGVDLFKVQDGRIIEKLSYEKG